MEYLDITIVPSPNPVLADIEAILEDLFIAPLKQMFANDDEFLYSEDTAESRLSITLEYPKKKDAPMAKPHLLISGIGYSFNLDTSLLKNFAEDRFDTSGFNNQSVEATKIPYSLTITAIGGHSVSKNLANRVINYMILVYKKVFMDLGLNIMSVNKSPTMNSSKYPEEVFDTSIQVQGNITWTGITSYLDKVSANALTAINITTETE